MELTEQIIEYARYEGESYVTKSGRKRWREHVLWDERVPGLGVKISSTGRKTFIVSYRSEGRKRTRTLGRVGELTLALARERAARLVEQGGAEPAQPAGGLEGVETVADLAQAYLERHLMPNKASWYAEKRLIRNHVNPVLGRSRLDEVTPGDLANFRAQMNRKFPSEARKLAELVNDMFRWAEEQGGPVDPPAEDAAVVESEPKDEDTRGTVEPEAAEGAAPAAESAAEEEGLAAALEEAERQRQQLADRLAEVSAGGAEMMQQLNDAAADRRRLEAELETLRQDLRRARRETGQVDGSDKVRKEKALLQASVEQLMALLKESESKREELAACVDEAAGREEALAEKLRALRRQRGDLEKRVYETERRQAVTAAVRKGGGSSGLRAAGWALGGLVLGVVLMLALQRPRAGPDEVAASLAVGPPEAGTESAPEAAAVSPARPVQEEPEEPVAAAAAAAPALTVAPAEGRPTAAAVPAESPGEEIAQRPESPPAPEVAPAPVPDAAAVPATVGAWAAAWSEQRVDDYLSFYAGEFEPPGRMTRAAWEAQRRERILRPASIRLTLGPITQTPLDPDRVRASFAQAYATPTYQDEVTKTLELVWVDGAWKIAAEAAD